MDLTLWSSSQYFFSYTIRPQFLSSRYSGRGGCSFGHLWPTDADFPAALFFIIVFSFPPSHCAVIATFL